MANGSNSIRITDGSVSFEGGIDSGKVPTIASQSMPTGLRRNQLAWLTNGTCRGGGINQRTGFKPLIQDVGWTGIYQGGYMYEPDFANPYLVLQIGGAVYQVRVDLDTPTVTNLSASFGEFNPATEPQAFMTQGEIFLVIQAGDLTTLPLFWDGALLRRSAGLPAELPPAQAMDYFMGRIWYAYGRQYAGGDIVRGPSGTSGGPYYRRDSILKTTENNLTTSGDGFVVPSNAGNIRAITHTAELDTALGQGNLYIGTRKSIYRNNVPVTRTDWIAAVDANQPLQTVSQIRYGMVGDRSVVRVNGDIFYQTVEPGIRSLALATRYFHEWANTAISRNVNRVLRFNDRALLRFSSGIEFNNRLYQTVLPFESDKGVAHRGILSLDFDLISSLGEKVPPAWEGMLEGLDILQLFEGDFGGLQRAFAIVVSRLTGEIEVWELTQFDRRDNGDNRVSWYFETPAYTFGNEFRLKEIESLEIWYDKLFGKVDFEVYWRPDQHPCYYLWHVFSDCAARDCTEDADINPPCYYPGDPYCELYKATTVLPKPPVVCNKVSARPAHHGYQFQIKIVIKGWCRIRGLLLHGFWRGEAPFHGLTPC